MKYTIAIPAYKDKFLYECIESILRQTYHNFELIVVDDASPNNIKEIVDQFNDTRLSYYRNESNFGALNVVDNWNKCLSIAQGDYIALMGDDDMLAPNFLEEFDRLIKSNPGLGIYHCRTQIIDDNSEVSLLTELRPEFESVYECIWHRISGWRTQFISDFIYDTKLLKSNGGFYKLPLAWSSDDITSYIAAANTGIANTNRILFYYRSNPQTISSTGSAIVKAEAIIQENKWLSEFLINSIPILDEDKLLKLIILKNLNKYITKKKVFTITSDLNSSYLHIFKWVNQRKRLNISFSLILYSLFLSFKHKLYLKHKSM